MTTRTDQVELRAWEHALSGDLDSWFNTAHDGPDPSVREAASTAMRALTGLRVAMDELTRAQEQAARGAA